MLSELRLRLSARRFDGSKFFDVRCAYLASSRALIAACSSVNSSAVIFREEIFWSRMRNKQASFSPVFRNNRKRQRGHAVGFAIGVLAKHSVRFSMFY